MRLAIVTATTNRARSKACLDSWVQHMANPPFVHIVDNGPDHGGYLGTVAAFRRGVDTVLALDSDLIDVIACLHDDLTITELGWDAKVLRHFDRQPACGLLGFGGAIGLGADTLYQTPYDPMQLARIGFRSNLRDAELHGIRSLLPERVACLDGFSQVGRRAFWLGEDANGVRQWPRPWAYLEEIGITHHFYDGCLGALARRYGWETWYLPVACSHAGGQTAVGDPGYQAWASQQIEGGDHGFWERAHAAGYAALRDVLPLRV